MDVVHQNYQDLYRFVYRMAGNRETAEDIVQETFLRWSREIPSLPDANAKRRWLFVVARNLCISQFRRKGKFLETPLGEGEELHASDGNPSDSLLEDERTQIVKQAVLSLPPLLREILVLREFEGMNYLDIASVVGCPIGTVRSRLAKARNLLMEKLQPYVEA